MKRPTDLGLEHTGIVIYNGEKGHSSSLLVTKSVLQNFKFVKSDHVKTMKRLAEPDHTHTHTHTFSSI